MPIAMVMGTQVYNRRGVANLCKRLILVTPKGVVARDAGLQAATLALPHPLYVQVPSDCVTGLFL